MKNTEVKMQSGPIVKRVSVVSGDGGYMVRMDESWKGQEFERVYIAGAQWYPSEAEAVKVAEKYCEDLYNVGYRAVE